MNLKEFLKNLSTRRKSIFPFTPPNFRFIAAWGLFIISSLFAAPSSADTARKQIHASVVASATTAIEKESQSRNWPKYQVKMNLFIPAEAAQYASCSHPPTVSLARSDRVDLNRMRFDVRCNDKGGWNIAVTVKPDIYLPVVIAKVSMPRGHVITPSDVTIKKHNISNNRSGFITNPNEIMGLAVKRNLRELQPISLTQLEGPVLVERGQTVVMIARHDGIEARTMGVAMKKGRKGEVIKVKNSSSGREVSAIVDDVGVVRMVIAPDK